MLSVCIPVYRYNATALVQELLRQVQEYQLTQDYELLLYDDASPDDGDWGKITLRNLAGIRYVELSRNLGRAAIRNRMVRDAQGTCCILLDADAGVPNDYLLRYHQYLQHPDHARNDELVMVGGRQYSTTEPKDRALVLHWWYGHRRESDALSVPADQGWLGFHSNNFLASRALLLAHPFPESVAGYGHEDTLWGQQFIESTVRIMRVKNPVVHLGLETNDVFLRKQREAIGNLHRLKQQTPHLRTRLIDLVEKYPRITALARILPEQLLINHLCQRRRPNLKMLDLLKLKWWYDLVGS